MIIIDMPGGPPGGLGMAGGPNSMAAAMAAAAGMSSQLPPHILAAQRAGVLPGGTKTATDYTRYFRRFSSSLECGSYYCKDMNYREHFHCTVPMCKSKVWPKKFQKVQFPKKVENNSSKAQHSLHFSILLLFNIHALRFGH